MRMMTWLSKACWRHVLLPALWQLDAALLAAGLRGLLRSVALGLVLHAMVAAKAAPTADFSYG